MDGADRRHLAPQHQRPADRRQRRHRRRIGGLAHHGRGLSSHLLSVVPRLGIARAGPGGVLVVWRPTEAPFPYIYYQWSNAWGGTWSEPAAIPGIRARPRTNN